MFLNFSSILFHCFPGVPYRREGYSWLHILTLHVFALMCAPMCALNWLTRCYGSPCVNIARSHYSRMRGGRWGRKKERKKEREDIDQAPCASNSKFTWPSKLLPSSPQCTADVHPSLAFFLLSSLHCPFVSAPCGFVCERSCFLCVCVCVCVCACLSCR